MIENKNTIGEIKVQWKAQPIEWIMWRRRLQDLKAKERKGEQEILPIK